MAEWETNDLRTAILSNKKNVYVMDSAPTTAYEGQVWVCTSSDPPLVKVYDLTNTQWMEYHAIYYEAVTSGQMPAVTPVTNGTLAIAYDTEQSSTTLFAYANGSWRDMGGALTQVYPLGNVEASGKPNLGTDNISGDHGTSVNLVSGVEVTLHQINITPLVSGATICAFGGGWFNQGIPGAAFNTILYVGATQVDIISGGGQTNYALKGFVDGVEDTSTAIYLKAKIYTPTTSGCALVTAGTSLAAISVKT